MSTGRIFQNKDDPTAVARSIMELREKREKEQKSTTRRHSSNAPVPPPPPPPPDSVLKQKTRYTKSGGHDPSGAGASSRQYSSTATPRGGRGSEPGSHPPNNNRFQQAEHRIEGFRKDLHKLKNKQDEFEEMQFFNELEEARPSPQKLAAGIPPPPPNPPPGNNKVRGSTPNSSVTRSASTPRPRTSSAVGSTGGAGVGGGPIGIPMMIRAAASPSRGGRLPPPKKAILSPRKIAALDRTSLELETQTLGRSVQILEQEKANLIRTVEMYDNTCQQETNKMRKLENDLKRVTADLNAQLQESEEAREAQRIDYEQKFREQAETLVSTQSLAEELEHELAQLHEGSLQQRAEDEKVQAKLEKELQNEKAELEAQANNFDQRITEVNVRVEKLQSKLKSKDKDLGGLKGEIAEAGKALHDAKTEKDEAYEVRLEALQQQLALAKDQYEKLEEENEEQNQMIREQGDLLGDNEQKLKAMTKSRDALKREIKSSHDEYKNELMELKKTYTDREKRRQDEDVEVRHADKEDFECRLKSLQEQLTLATDRHHAEIRQKEADLEERYGEIKIEIQKDVGEKLILVENELYDLRGEYDVAKVEISKLQAENDELTQEHSLELQQRDALRDEEVASLKEQLAETARELTEKSFKLDKVSAQMKERENEIEKLEAEFVDLQAANVEALAEQRTQASSTQDILRNKIEEREYEVVEMESKLANLEEDCEAIRESLTKANQSTEEAQISAKKREAELQGNYTRIKREFIDDQARHEQVEGDLRYDVAKLDSKLKASETSLTEKRQQIHDLEDKLDTATEVEARGQNLQQELAKMKMELRTCENDLDEEKSNLSDKTDEANQLRRALDKSSAKEKNLQEQVEMLSNLEADLEVLRENADNEKLDLESKLSSLQATADKLKDEKLDASVEMSRLEQDNTTARKQLGELRLQLSDANSKEHELTNAHERYTRKIESLQSQLENETSAKDELVRRLSAMEDAHNETKEAQTKATKDIEHLQSQLADETDTKDSFARRLAEANDMRLELEESVEMVSSEMKLLKSRLDSERREKNSLKDELTLRKSEFDDISSEYEETKSLLSELEMKVSEGSGLADELQLAKQQINLTEQYKTKASGLQAKVVALQAKVSDLEEQVQGEGIAREIAEVKLTKLQEELDDATRNLEEEQLTATSRSLSAEQTTKQVDDLQEQIVELHKQLEAENKSETTLLNNLHEMEEDYSDALAKLKEAEEQLQEKETQDKLLSDLRASYAEKTEVAEALQEKLSQVEESATQSKTGELLGLQMQLEELEASKKSLMARFEKLEEDRDRKTEQLSKSSERYSSNIEELQSKLEEQMRSKESLRQKLIDLEADLSVKENQSNLLSDVHARLREQAKAKEALQSKLREVEDELEMRKKQSTSKGDQLSELQMSLDEVSKEKEILQNKVDEIESELARKDRKITGIIERQAEDTDKLEQKLKDQTMAKATLQQAVDNLQSEMHGFEDNSSSETAELRKKIASLENSIEEANEGEARAAEVVQDVEGKLLKMEDLHKELEQRYNKVNGEKEEVIAALEDVIHEVQSREEEIESLASILRKRDEELDHAKLIATKALASAQEMKSRYKEKGGRDSAQNSELKNKIEHLSEQIEFLSKKNESLQRRTATLEAELQDRNITPRDTVGGSSNSVAHSVGNSVASSVGSGGSRKVRPAASGSSSMKGFHNGVSTDSDGFALMDELEDTFPSFDSQSPTSQLTSQSKKQVPFDENETMSTYSADIGETTKGWIHDFDSESTSSSNNRDSFDEAKSEPGVSQSRRSIERDALRKYVRKRYMKHKGGSSQT